ncbi:hypothetical protein HII36_06490 [Nonomuraea sp. NN258]|uniref:DUF6461 domain-containing protein n=1 Tax=Nonomuraea antri TaxID=2730852 RepID=UPI001568CF59|nr:hypothetical protein [Nonomuraea antri]
MSGATAADYAWLAELCTDGDGDAGLCLTFVRGLSPDEAFRRIGAVPDATDGCRVGGYSAHGGTVLEYEWAGMLWEQSVPLSAGTVAATVFVDLKHDDFCYLVDGRRVSSFCWFAYSLRDGVFPDPLLADVHELGLDRDDSTEEPLPNALALAERATGVRLQRADFVRPSLMGSIRRA